MSLDLKKLQKVVNLGTDGIRARCPACAEEGRDRKGEHLKIYSDGRFGCCVHPADREHRKRIFLLAGERDHQPRTIEVRSTKISAGNVILSGIFERLETTLRNSVPQSSPIQNEAGEALKFTEGSTTASHPGESDCRTFRTPSSNSPGYSQMELSGTDRELPEPVRCVREHRSSPFFTADGTLVIPFTSPCRYHWWNGGQSISQTRAELECVSRDEQR
jgi:hypothetical protein